MQARHRQHALSMQTTWGFHTDHSPHATLGCVKRGKRPHYSRVRPLEKHLQFWAPILREPWLNVNTDKETRMMSGPKKRREEALPLCITGCSEQGTGCRCCGGHNGSTEELADHRNPEASRWAGGLLIKEVSKQKVKGHPVW